jgi:multisubunit Na+/H+ antiporter MnhB subunit
MPLANQLSPIATLGLVIVGLIGLLALVFSLLDGYERWAQRSLERKYAGLDIHEFQHPGDVKVSYHTCHGVLIWFTVAHHCVWLPPDQARLLLGRLLRFNLCWGLLARGGIFVGPLAIVNYIAQRRSVNAQEIEGIWAAVNAAAKPSPVSLADSSGENPLASPQAPLASHPVSRWTFRVVVGWIIAVFSALFVIIVVANLLMGEFDAAFGFVAISALLAWVARNWIRTPG